MKDYINKIAKVLINKEDNSNEMETKILTLLIIRTIEQYGKDFNIPDVLSLAKAVYNHFETEVFVEQTRKIIMSTLHCSQKIMDEKKVQSITISKNGILYHVKDRAYGTFDFGKTVFLTSEEAEQALEVDEEVKYEHTRSD